MSHPHMNVGAGVYDANPEWRERASCRGVDVKLFFAGSGGDFGPAKTICGLCPVRRECLAYALGISDLPGFFGGKSEKERIKLQGRRG